MSFSLSISCNRDGCKDQFLPACGFDPGVVEPILPRLCGLGSGAGEQGLRFMSGMADDLIALVPGIGKDLFAENVLRFVVWRCHSGSFRPVNPDANRLLHEVTQTLAPG